MESNIIENLGCPLDTNLLKSWEQFSLDSSYSHTSSDFSESDAEETEIEPDVDLIRQIKNLSFAEASDSKHITPKSSIKTSEINSQEKDITGELIFVANKEIEEIRSSSSSLKHKGSLKFVEEADVKSTFCKCPNNCEICSKKNTDISSSVESLENVEKQFSSLTLKNEKILNKCYESGFDISAEEESDSDDDEQEETVTLRERDPTRRNRPEINKQQRTTPFPRNRSKTSKLQAGVPFTKAVPVVPSAAANVEKQTSFNSCLENLSAEEVVDILKILNDSTSDDRSSQDHVDLASEGIVELSIEDVENILGDSSISNRKICVESTDQKFSYPNNNQHYVPLEPDHEHSSFSKPFGESYTISVCRNISSINGKSSSPKTPDNEKVSIEIEDRIKRILSNDFKRKNINKTTEPIEIYTMYRTAARNMLFNSPSFCKIEWECENEEIKRQIKSGKLGTEENKVIHMMKKNRTTKYRGTNLHLVIREGKIEKAFCLVEYHKECHGSLTEINLRDNSDKTVLDCSREKGLDLLSAYLEENDAKSYSDICN